MGKAEKGGQSRARALPQYYGVDFEIAPSPSGAALRLLNANTGWASGYLRALKVEKQFQQLGDRLAAWFQQQGMLLGKRDG